jgi:hypothetical protein
MRHIQKEEKVKNRKTKGRRKSKIIAIRGVSIKEVTKA